jgi:hypothetical protein
MKRDIIKIIPAMNALPVNTAVVWWFLSVPAVTIGIIAPIV